MMVRARQPVSTLILKSFSANHLAQCRIRTGTERQEQCLNYLHLEADQRNQSGESSENKGVGVALGKATKENKRKGRHA